MRILISGSLWFTLVPFGPLGASPAAIAAQLPEPGHPTRPEPEPELSGSRSVAGRIPHFSNPARVDWSADILVRLSALASPKAHRWTGMSALRKNLRCALGVGGYYPENLLANPGSAS